MEQVSTRKTAPRDCLRTSLKHRQKLPPFWRQNHTLNKSIQTKLSLHLTNIFLKLTWNANLTLWIFATQCRLDSTFLHFLLNRHFGVSSSLHTCCLRHTETQKVLSGHTASHFPQTLYSPFCFWCVKETGSREKWQQQSHCGRVIRKESRLTHRGGAVLNKHTSKCRPTPLVPGVTQF